MQTTIDSAGRLVIPKALRPRAGLRAGMELQLEYHEGKIEIEPVRQSVRLVRRGSRLTLAAPPGTRPLTNAQVNRILEEIRVSSNSEVVFANQVQITLPHTFAPVVL